MNEVQAMAKIGQVIGTVLGTAILTVRRASVGLGVAGARASRRAARRTRKGLARRGLAPEQLQKASRRAARSAARQHRAAQKTLVENVTKARRELAARIEPAPPPHRRRWLWVVTLVSVAAGVAAYILSRRPQEQPAPARPVEPPRALEAAPSIAPNGAVPASSEVRVAAPHVPTPPGETPRRKPVEPVDVEELDAEVAAATAPPKPAADGTAEASQPAKAAPAGETEAGSAAEAAGAPEVAEAGKAAGEPMPAASRPRAPRKPRTPAKPKPTASSE